MGLQGYSWDLQVRLWCADPLEAITLEILVIGRVLPQRHTSASATRSVYLLQVLITNAYAAKWESMFTTPSFHVWHL